MKPSVSIVKCEDYGEEKVLKGLRKAIDLLGGIDLFVKKGDRVLLKPNLLYGKPPEKAVTTHPIIVKGMIKIVREAGGIPFIGDSPSIGGLIKTAEKSGIKEVSDEMGCPLVEFNNPVNPPRDRTNIFKQLEIDREALDADVIINLPKLKTHTLMLLTLGVKNLFGCVPGPRKALWHLKAGEDRKIFAQILVDIYRALKPHLTILDGILAMEGDGPNSGNPVPIGLILASGDSLNLDQIVCDILGISRKSLLTNRVAFEQGMGLERIDVLGERLEDVKVSKFQFPEPTQPDWNMPGFLRNVLKNGFSSKPLIEKDICKVCERCIEVCPTKALKRGRAGLIFNDKKCIRCFCCQEVCPEGAIVLKIGWIMNLYKKISPIHS